MIYIQGPGCQKCLSVLPPAPATFPPPEGTICGWYPNTIALPSCPRASIYSQMTHRCYNPEQVSVCQINGKTYWTGTIMQTNEITDQLCPKKSGFSCWQYDPGYRVKSPLDPHLYQVLNATHCLLNDTKPQLARDCWLCLLLGAPPEKTLAIHSSNLAWKTPWMEQPGRLQSMGLLRVRYD